MPLKVVRRKASQVPPPPPASRIRGDLERLKSEISTLSSDAVLEVEAVSEQAIKGVKSLITRASRQVGVEIRHWHIGTKVFAQPKAPVVRRNPAQAEPASTARARKPATAAAPTRKVARQRKTT